MSPDLPSPLATSTGTYQARRLQVLQVNIDTVNMYITLYISGMLQCNVIKSFGEVVQHKYNSEEEIDEAIQSYSTVGSRLANQNDHTLSDVDVTANKSRGYWRKM